MDEFSLACRCGKRMAPHLAGGSDVYRCQCGAAVRVTAPRRARGCVIPIGTGTCGGTRVPTFPVCVTHALRLAHAVVNHESLRTELAEESALLEYNTDRQEFLDKIRADEARRRADFNARHKGLRPDAHVVYYVRLSEYNIKIGTTAVLPDRMQALRVVRPEDVLAAEPGRYALEKERHRQFNHLRWDPRKEDFKPGQDLLDHVVQVRAEHGDPHKLYASLVAKSKAPTVRSA